MNVRGLLIASTILTATVACKHHPAGRESPPPFPKRSPPISAHEPQPHADSKIAWSFESGLDGWSIEAGGELRSCDPVSIERIGVAAAMRSLGDYWRTSADVGADGRCRLDTGPERGRGSIAHSPQFEITLPILAFSIGGEQRTESRLELSILEGTEWRTVEKFEAFGTLAMRRASWDVARHLGKRARISLIDDGGGSTGLLVDEIFDAAVPPSARAAPVWGFADLHAHPVSQLGFGGHILVGKNDGPIDVALQPCTIDHGPNGSGGKAGILMSAFETPVDLFPGHHNGGSPKYEGWPRYSTLVHQQMYVDWIRRAWEGGLRLMVAQAVNNELLAEVFGGEGDYKDMAVVKKQLDEMRAFAGRHADFMEIASKPAEARRIIGAGKLAIVLGAEVDAIGACRKKELCDAAKVKQAIAELHELGVRHIFPIHLSDNAFGGSAIFGDGMLSLLTWYLTGDYYQIAGSPAVAWRFSKDEEAFAVKAMKGIHKDNLDGNAPYSPPYDEYAAIPGGHLNARGLTELGIVAVEEIIRLGMIIDADHMSERSRTEVFEIASRRGAPLVMGHVWFRDLGYEAEQTQDPNKRRHERMGTAEEVDRIYAAGGLIGAMGNQGDVRRAEAAGLDAECPGSSTSWANAYAYAVDRTGGAPVAIGTDFNGFIMQPGPRFGMFACPGRMLHGGNNDYPRRNPGATMGESIRRDAERQDFGVTYSAATKIRDVSLARFYGLGRDSPLRDRDDFAFSLLERAIWIALASSAAGHSEQQKLLLGPFAASVALGFDDRAPFSAADPWRRAAHLVRHSRNADGESYWVRDAYEKILPIWKSWKKMESGNASATMTRSGAEQRDFDINLDGLAHYGMLPDFFQDVANQLRAGTGSVRDLSALFQSSERYLRAWEKAEAAARAAQ